MGDFTASAPQPGGNFDSQSQSQSSPNAYPPLGNAQRLRLWPALVLVALLWAAILIPPRVAPDEMLLVILGAVWGPMVVTAGIAAWWMFASRIPWSQRWLGLLSFAGIGLVACLALHPSMAPFVIIVFALPMLLTSWVGWLALTPFLNWTARIGGLLIVFLLSWGFWDLLRFEGTTGEFTPAFRARWEPTDEQKLMADIKAGKVKTSSGPAEAIVLTAKEGDWPGFRGAKRDGILQGVRIATDWSARPPRELWRRPVGPGWGSFTVIGDRIYTQEQRGEEELVVCYDAGTGNELWTHKNAVRFTEAIAGPGPRATPTFDDGRLYAFGATGKLDCLDAATGKLLWSRDVKADTEAKEPTWGFASSPLVWKGVVSVFAGGPEGKSVVGYQASSGEPLWAAGSGLFSYCSPHPATIDNVEQILINTEAGVTSIDPNEGKVLWQHDWALDGGMSRVVQPALVGSSDILVGTFFGMGTRRVNVSRQEDGWKTKNVWTTRVIKPYYNDMVLHKGHLYGFDSAFFTCVNLEDGKSKWRVRGYDNGQVLLLADQDLLLILAEDGTVALVEATPTGHKELSRFQGIKGKTWNHPVVAHGKLFIRNGKEAACFELRPEKEKP